MSAADGGTPARRARPGRRTGKRRSAWSSSAPGRATRPPPRCSPTGSRRGPSRRRARRGHEVAVTTIELRTLANEIAAALVSQNLGPRLTAAVEALGAADGIDRRDPGLQGGRQRALQGFFDVLDNDLLIGRPVALAATAGTARHALVVDEAMRSLFAYMRTLTIPTAVFAATEDWSGGGARGADRPRRDRARAPDGERLRRARSRSSPGAAYQHEYGSAGGTELAIDLDSDLMRLATGGSGEPRDVR